MCGLAFDQRIRAIHMDHQAAEVVRRTAMQRGATDERRVTLEAHRAAEDFDIAFDLLSLRFCRSTAIQFLPCIVISWFSEIKRLISLKRKSFFAACLVRSATVLISGSCPCAAKAKTLDSRMADRRMEGLFK